MLTGLFCDVTATSSAAARSLSDSPPAVRTLLAVLCFEGSDAELKVMVRGNAAVTLNHCTNAALLKAGAPAALAILLRRCVGALASSGAAGRRGGDPDTEVRHARLMTTNDCVRTNGLRTDCTKRARTTYLVCVLRRP